MKKLLSKITAVFLSMIFALSCSVSLFAYNENEEIIYVPGQKFDSYEYYSDDEMDVYNLLYSAFLNCEARVEMYVYKILTTEISKLYHAVIMDHAELFYVATSFSFSQVGDYVYAVLPRYSMTGTRLNDAKTIFNTKISEIVSIVPKGISNVGKALFVHDYIALNYEYDNDDNNYIYDVYNMLVYNKGVCQAYSLLYSYIMNLLGVETQCISSNDMNHMWNIIKIDDEWYNVDTTWDDPVNDVIGRVRHRYFLVSDESIFYDDGNHYGWQSDYVCISTKYDTYGWQESNSAFVYLNGDYYYINNSDNTINRFDLATGEGSVILQNNDRWYVRNTSYYYTSGYSFLAEHNGLLYFNSTDKIYTLDVDTMVKSVNRNIDVGTNKIFGFRIYDEMINCLIIDDISSDFSAADIELFDLSVIDMGYTYSITDKNNTVIEILQQNPTAKLYAEDGTEITDEAGIVGTGSKIVNNGESYIIIIIGDLDGNGIVNNKDVTLIKRHLVGKANLSETFAKAAEICSTSSVSRRITMLSRYVSGIINSLSA